MPSGAAVANITKAERWHVGEGRPLQFRNVDANGTPVAMTNWDLQWTLHRAPDTAALVTKTTTEGDIVIANGAATDDYATVDTDPADTTGLAPGRYYHYLRRTDNTDQDVISEGEVELLPAVTAV